MNYAEQLHNGAYNFLSVSIYLHILFRKEARLVLFYSIWYQIKKTISSKFNM